MDVGALGTWSCQVLRQGDTAAVVLLPLLDLLLPVAFLLVKPALEKKRQPVFVTPQSHHRRSRSHGCRFAAAGEVSVL